MHFISKWTNALTITSLISLLFNSTSAIDGDTAEHDRLIHFMELMQRVKLDSLAATLTFDCDMHWYQPFLSVEIGDRDISFEVEDSQELGSHVLDYGAVIRNDTINLRLAYQTVVKGDYNDYQTSIRDLYLTKGIVDNTTVASVAYGRRKLNDIVLHTYYYDLSTQLLHISIGRYIEPIGYGSVDTFVGKTDNDNTVTGMHLFGRTVFNTPLDIYAHMLLIGDQSHIGLNASYDLGHEILGIEAECHASLLNICKDKADHLTSSFGLLIGNGLQEGWTLDLTYHHISELMLSNSERIGGDIFIGHESDRILKHISGDLSQIAATLSVVYSENLLFCGHTSYSTNDSMVFDNNNITHSGNGRLMTSFLKMVFSV